MSKKIVVIGLGTFGREVALSLSRSGYSVLAVDQDPEAVEEIKDDVDSAVVLDTTDETALFEAKIDEMPIAVCAIGAQHMEDSIMTTALLHQLEVPRIIARALNQLHARILKQVGATEVVNPEQEMGRRVAFQVSSPGFREMFTLADGVCVAEVPVPPSFVGQTLAGLQVRHRYSLTVIGVERVVRRKETESATATADSAEARRSVVRRLLDQERKMMLNLGPKDQLLADDTLVVIGAETDIKRMTGLG